MAFCRTLHGITLEYQFLEIQGWKSSVCEPTMRPMGGGVAVGREKPSARLSTTAKSRCLSFSCGMMSLGCSRAFIGFGTVRLGNGEACGQFGRMRWARWDESFAEMG